MPKCKSQSGHKNPVVKNSAVNECIAAKRLCLFLLQVAGVPALIDFSPVPDSIGFPEYRTTWNVNKCVRSDYRSYDETTLNGLDVYNVRVFRHVTLN